MNDQHMPQRPPTDEERMRAANIELSKAERKRKAKKQDPIADRMGWRNRVAAKYKDPKHWAELWEVLGQTSATPLPEEPEEEASEPRPGTVLDVLPCGRRRYLTESNYRDLVYDFEGDIDEAEALPVAEGRPTREPVSWLKLKHPALYGKATRMGLCLMDLCDRAHSKARARYRHMSDRGVNIERNLIFQLDRLEILRELVARS